MSMATRHAYPREAKDAYFILREVLAGSLLGVYLFGSTVVGGLRPDSDVDVLAVSRKSLSNEERQRLSAELMKVSGTHGERTSARPIELTLVRLSDVVPWQYPPQSQFIYGEWLRQSVSMRTGVRPAPDPDLAIVLTTVSQNSIAMRGPRAKDLLDVVPPDDVRRAISDSLPELIERAEGDERNVLLTLARMWMTSATGAIEPKDVAAGWALTRLPPEHSSVLRLARSAYLGESADEWGARKQELSAAMNYMRQSVEASLRKGAEEL